MNEPTNREETIFHAVLLLPPEKRAEYLDLVCAGDPALRERVGKLIEAQAKSDSFFQKDALAVASGEEKATIVEPPSEGPGTVIGRYKLREKIGEGGCGIVYVADQEEPVRRRVALKVIKLGMDTRSVIARFEAERQALAMMDHPNIAKVLDAGATEAGRPYFVMELVRGIKITEYCDQNNLSTKERLDLFIKVCQAVQHAHQKGIIHRDLKPSNILVTLHDGVPIPKVIDFGIAKATEGKLTDLTIYTELYQFIGTPAYMSPEQAEMSGLDIDTRSDVYSLGVLLYELLTGKTPFDAKELIAAGIDEMRRTIREKEPARPSTCLSTMLAADLTTTAKRRQMEGPRLIHQLRGDLDWIVMKALEKDRTRRYETANGFAADIQRYLTSEPVVARPPSAVYKFQKAVRRNRLAYAAAGAVLLALVLGLIMTRRQAARAKRAENLANARLAEVTAERDAKDQARKEAEEVSTLLQNLFQSPDPARDGRTITVAETLDRAVKHLQTGMNEQPATRARLLKALGNTYLALGLYKDAIPLQEEVRAYLTGKPEWEEVLFDHLNALARSYFLAGRNGEALRLREEIVEFCKESWGAEHANTLRMINNLALSYQEAGRREEALRLQEEVVALSRKADGTNISGLTATSMGNLANSYLMAGRPEEALTLCEEVLAARKAALGLRHPATINALANLGLAYSRAGRHDEALKLNEESFALSRTVNGPEHPATLVSMRILVDCYATGGKHAEAIKLSDEFLELSSKLHGSEHHLTLDALAALARAHGLAGQHRKALEIFEKLLAIERKVRGPEHFRTIHTMRSLGVAYFHAGRKEERLNLLRQVVTAGRVSPGLTGEQRLDDLSALAEAYAEAGQADEMVSTQDEVLKLSRSLFGTNDLRTVVAIHDSAWSNLKLGKEELARQLLTSIPNRGITNWLILSPIRHEATNSAKVLAEELISPEAALSPREGQNVTVKGQPLVWRAYQARDFILDFEWHLSNRVEHAAGYAACYLVSENDQQNLLLTVSSDDQARVYLNEKLVYECLRARPIQEAADQVQGLGLKRGVNTIIFKIVNGESQWRGALSLTQADGTPLKGVRVTLDPKPTQ